MMKYTLKDETKVSTNLHPKIDTVDEVSGNNLNFMAVQNEVVEEDKKEQVVKSIVENNKNLECETNYMEIRLDVVVKVLLMIVVFLIFMMILVFVFFYFFDDFGDFSILMFFYN